MSSNVGTVVRKKSGLPNNRSGIMKRPKGIFGQLQSGVGLVAKSASQGATLAQYNYSCAIWHVPAFSGYTTYGSTPDCVHMACIGRLGTARMDLNTRHMTQSRLWPPLSRAQATSFPVSQRPPPVFPLHFIQPGIQPLTHLIAGWVRSQPYHLRHLSKLCELGS